ncbi:MAG: S-layer homology domain-containing protein [Chloroflexota bacterium]
MSNLLRRFSIISFSFIFFLMGSLSAFASTFSDVPGDAWFFGYVDELSNSGIIDGYSDNTFKPAGHLYRAEAIKLVVEAFIPEEYQADSYDADFGDVHNYDWYGKYIQTALNFGIIEEKDNFFPGNKINRAEFAKMVVIGAGVLGGEKGYDIFSDVSSGDWFFDYVNPMSANDIIGGYSDNTFKPGNSINRAESAKIISESLGYLAELDAGEMVECGDDLNCFEEKAKVCQLATVNLYPELEVFGVKHYGGDYLEVLGRNGGLCEISDEITKYEYDEDSLKDYYMSLGDLIGLEGEELDAFEADVDDLIELTAEESEAAVGKDRVCTKTIVQTGSNVNNWVEGNFVSSTHVSYSGSEATVVQEVCLSPYSQEYTLPIDDEAAALFEDYN